jgi:hypothetical protein
VRLGLRVREPQEVRAEALIALERVDEVGGRRILVIAQRDDALSRRVEDRKVGERGDRTGAVLCAVGIDGGRSVPAILCVQSLHGWP